MKKNDYVFVSGGRRGIISRELDNDMVEVRLLSGSGTVCVGRSDLLKSTYDWRPIYPAGSELPEGASGFQLCRLFSGSYSIELRAEDRERAQADRIAIEAKLKAIRTKDAVAIELRALGLEPSGKLADSKVQLGNALYERAWPLIEFSSEVGK